MAKISAFIITKNEELRVARTINSLKGVADEIIVVDSGSTDNTLQICRELGVKVIFNPWAGYVKQKIFGENLCTNQWIINLDADEELSRELQHEINYIFQSDIQERYVAYQIKLMIMHRNDVTPRIFAPYNRCTRLYNRKFASFAGEGGVELTNNTHDSVILNPDVAKGKIYSLNEPAYHYSGTSISQLVEKANFYSGEQAKELIAAKKYPSSYRTAFEMVWYFLKTFFVRRYFVFGFDGFVDSMIFAFARFLRLAKAREMYKKINTDEMTE